MYETTCTSFGTISTNFGIWRELFPYSYLRESWLLKNRNQTLLLRLTSHHLFRPPRYKLLQYRAQEATGVDFRCSPASLSYATPSTAFPAKSAARRAKQHKWGIRGCPRDIGSLLSCPTCHPGYWYGNKLLNLVPTEWFATPVYKLGL